jgi:hypothetical protein
MSPPSLPTDRRVEYALLGCAAQIRSLATFALRARDTDWGSRREIAAAARREYEGAPAREGSGSAAQKGLREFGDDLTALVAGGADIGYWSQLEVWPVVHDALIMFDEARRSAPPDRQWEAVWARVGPELAQLDAKALDRMVGALLDTALCPASPPLTAPTEAPPAEAAGAGVPTGDGPSRRPCYGRDHTWLRWAEEENMKPAGIRDRWNKEHSTETVGQGASGYDVVKKGLAKARADRDSG